MNNKWFVYILLCNDNSLYTGITTDLNRRVKEHRSGLGAKYTKSKGVKDLIKYFEGPDRSWASKTEAKIKKLSKDKKWKLVESKEII